MGIYRKEKRMKKSIFLWMVALLGCKSAFSDTINLFNDSSVPLRAVIFGADGTELGEFVLNPRNASQWSNNWMNLDNDQNNASLIPYTVNWYCIGGGAYGVCSNVASGSLVTAQSCGGAQECSE